MNTKPTPRLQWRYFIAAAILLFAKPSQAQTVVGATTPEIVLAAGINAMNVNCDMMYRPNGGHLRAVVYDDINTNMGFVNLQDYAGGNLTIPIPGGLYPDIVIGDDMGAPGINYRIGVVYGASITRFATYTITGVGTGTLGATPVSNIQVSIPGSNTSRYPHIDLYPDLSSAPIGNYRAYHQFAITWSEALVGSPGMDVFVTRGDLMSPTVLSPYISVTAGGTGMMSDVACLVDVSTGNAWAYMSYFKTTTNNVDIAALNLTTGVLTITPSVGGNIASLPRIEAMNYHNPATGYPRYQVAYTRTSSPTVVWGYNNVLGNINLSTTLLGSFNNRTTAVAAGPGPLITPGAYGSGNYTAGWYINGAQRFGTRSISSTTGNISGAFPNIYITNLNPMTVTNFESPIAISTATNQGDRLLTAWSANGRVWYKYNSNTASYKPTDVNTVAAANDGTYSLYPNPATSMVTIDGVKEATYTVMDMAGRTLLQGNLTAGNKTINIGSLANGMYITGITENGATTLMKFSKQ